MKLRFSVTPPLLEEYSSDFGRADAIYVREQG